MDSLKDLEIAFLPKTILISWLTSLRTWSLLNFCFWNLGLVERQHLETSLINYSDLYDRSYLNY